MALDHSSSRPRNPDILSSVEQGIITHVTGISIPCCRVPVPKIPAEVLKLLSSTPSVPVAIRHTVRTLFRGCSRLSPYRQGDTEGSSVPAGARACPASDLAAMSLDNLFCDRQPQPVPCSFFVLKNVRRSCVGLRQVFHARYRRKGYALLHLWTGHESAGCL